MNSEAIPCRRTRVLGVPLAVLLVVTLLILGGGAFGMYLMGQRSIALNSAGSAPAETFVSLQGDATIVLGDTFPPDSSVFFFLRTDCPIGNRYAPKIAEIATEFRKFGFAFHCVYPDDNPEKIKQHQDDFRLGINAYHDPQHTLVDLLEITRAPEAVVIDRQGRRVYRGRIDNQFVDFGQTRRAATTDDLRDVLSAVARGEPVAPTTTEAVGCYIE